MSESFRLDFGRQKVEKPPAQLTCIKAPLTYHKKKEKIDYLAKENFLTLKYDNS